MRPLNRDWEFVRGTVKSGVRRWVLDIRMQVARSRGPRVTPEKIAEKITIAGDHPRHNWAPARGARCVMSFGPRPGPAWGPRGPKLATLCLRAKRIL